MRLVKLNARHWAAGLQWFQVSAKSKRDMNAVRSEGMKLKGDPPDMVAFRPRQYGFGASGGLAGYTTANPLAGGIGLPSSSFLGVFRLEDVHGESFWWVCAVRQGLISGQGDMVCASKEEADAQVAELTDLLGHFDDQAFCATWEESRAWLIPLLNYRRQARLRPLLGDAGFRRRLFALGAAISLVLVCGIGLRTYWNHQAEQQALQISRQQIEERAQRRADLLAHPERHFPMPWATARPVGAAARVCLESMLSLPLSAGGWQLTKAQCDGRTLTAYWDFSAGADYRLLPPGAVLETSTRARTSVRLDSGPDERRPDGDFRSLACKTDVSRHFYQLTANMGAHLSRFDFEKPATAVVDKVEIVAPWVRGSWELSAVPDALALDGSLAAALDMPGLVLSGMEYGNGWTLKGEVYATPE